MLVPSVVLTSVMSKTCPIGSNSFAILFSQPVIPVIIGLTVDLLVKYRKLSLIFATFYILFSLYVIWFGMYNLPYEIGIFGISRSLIFAILIQLIWIVCGVVLIFRSKLIPQKIPT